MSLLVLSLVSLCSSVSGTLSCLYAVNRTSFAELPSTAICSCDGDEGHNTLEWTSLPGHAEGSSDEFSSNLKEVLVINCDEVLANLTAAPKSAPVVTLENICLLFLLTCSILTMLRRRDQGKQFSPDNAAIHHKYQDTALQITTHGNSSCPGLQPSSEESGLGLVHETSFSCTHTDNSLDNLSQGSTALVRDSLSQPRNLNYCDTGLEMSRESLQSLAQAEEYTQEPSRMSWKRRRKSEEIL